jgi:hypothetical protein
MPGSQVRTIKSSGSGPFSEKVEEFVIDTAVLAVAGGGLWNTSTN